MPSTLVRVTGPSHMSKMPPADRPKRDAGTRTVYCVLSPNNCSNKKRNPYVNQTETRRGRSIFCLSVIGTAAFADDHAYTEGTVSQVAAIRTIEGHFDDYMAWIDTVWKKEQEAAKKAGYIVKYEVFVAQPRTENDADIYLMITYKNYAAMDDWIVKATPSRSRSKAPWPLLINLMSIEARSGVCWGRRPSKP